MPSVDYKGKVIKFPESMSIEDIERELTSPQESDLLQSILTKMGEEQEILTGISEKIQRVDLEPVLQALRSGEEEKLLSQILLAVQDKPQLDNSDVVNALGLVIQSQAETRHTLEKALRPKPQVSELEVTQWEDGRPKRVRVFYA